MAAMSSSLLPASDTGAFTTGFGTFLVGGSSFADLAGIFVSSLVLTGGWVLAVTVTGLVGGGGVGRLTGADASTTTPNEIGPILRWSLFFNSTSPLTGWSLTNVPLVLSKSRMNTLSSR